MKKSSLFILALVLILAALVLTACNGTEGGTKDPEGSTSSTTDGSDDVGKNTDNSEHIHSFSAWRTMNEPTCTEDGLEEQECACGEKSSRPIPAKGHTEVVDAAKDATCTETGLTEGKHCSVCNTVFVKQEVIPAKGHTEVVDTGKAAICTEAGLTDGKHCSVCNTVLVKQEVIPAEGHNFVNGVCSKCKEQKTSEGLKYTLSSDGQGYSVRGIGSCTDTDVVIPSTYNGKPVTMISMNAFKNCTGLTSITIPDSVASVGSAAFSGCTGLTSITISDSVASVGSSAFYNTAYYNNESNWVDGVLYIGNYLISAKASVSGSYTIKAGTICIASRAFIDGDYYCTDLTSITIPDSVMSIGAAAFSGCTDLTSITISDSVMKIGSSAFYNTAYYNNESNWVDGVLYIGNHLIEAKNSVSGNYTIKSGTKCIATDAFRNCTGLTSITIPDSVTNIGESAFRTCKNLTSITFKGTKAQWNTITKENDWDTNTGDYTVHCTDGDITK